MTLREKLPLLGSCKVPEPVSLKQKGGRRGRQWLEENKDAA